MNVAIIYIANCELFIQSLSRFQINNNKALVSFTISLRSEELSTTFSLCPYPVEHNVKYIKYTEEWE